MADISREEFERLYKTLTDGFDGVHARLDRLNGTVRDHGEQIAVLEDRGHPAAWAGGLSGIFITAAEALRYVFGK